MCRIFYLYPDLFPIAYQIGFDPIHFSIVILISLALGLFTPPVGTTLFLSCRLADAKIEEVAKTYYRTSLRLPLLYFW